jgi:hypothetical protein
MTEQEVTFADVLSTVPHNIGEVPTDSMVLILINDGYPVANLVFVMPERDITPSDVMLIVKKCLDVDFEHFFAVAYTDRPSKCEEHPNGYHAAQMIGLMMQMLGGKGLVGGGLVTSDHYLNFEEDGYPPHPLSEIAESPTALHLAVEHSHEGALMKISIPEPDLADRLSTLAIDQYVKNQGGPEVDDLDTVKAMPHYSVAREVWERCLARDFGPTRQEAIDLIGYLQIDGYRDRLIVDVTSKTEDETTFVRILKGQMDLPFSTSRMNNAVSVLLNLFQYARPKHRTALFVALGLLEYHRGQNLQAIEYLNMIPEKRRPIEYTVLMPHLTHGGSSMSANHPPLP